MRRVANDLGRVLVVTLGSRAVRIFDGRRRIGSPPSRFARSRSPGTTLGCGDAFIACFLDELWRSGDLDAAVARGMMGGAPATAWPRPLPDEAYVDPAEAPRRSAPPEESQMPIHLHAEPGDYAPVVILPGDPIRATKIAARFDGGLEASRQVNAEPRPRRLHGHGRRRPRLRPGHDDGHRRRPAIVVEELLMLGVDDVHPSRHDRRRSGASRSATWSWPWPRPAGPGSRTCSAAASRPRRRRTSTSSLALRDAAVASGPDDPRRPDRHRRHVLRRPEPGRRHPLGPPRLPLGRDGVGGPVPAGDARASEGPARPSRARS